MCTKDKHSIAHNSFELAKAIAKTLKSCSMVAPGDSAEGEDKSEKIRFLWINTMESTLTEGENPPRLLTEEEWLSIIDEAATVGVNFIVLHAQSPLAQTPALFAICDWAQKSYDMITSILFSQDSFLQEDIDLLQQLEPAKTWVCLDGQAEKLLTTLDNSGINHYYAHTDFTDHTPPCDMSNDMLFVGGDGVLYTCGLVVGVDEYNLGPALEKPLSDILTDDSLPHTIPAGAGPSGMTCAGCPPIIAARLNL